MNPSKASHSKASPTPLRMWLVPASLVAMLAVVASLHTPLAPLQAFASLALKLEAFWPVLLYLGAAFGLGRILSVLWRAASPDDRSGLQLATGLGLMLTLDQLLGIFGLLSPAVAIGITLIGLALAIDQLIRSRKKKRQAEPIEQPIFSLWWLQLLACPAIALLVVASLMPPGWLWASEFGGFDALSYHLDLPEQWMRLSHIVPLQNNVYSFLPSYLEGAFVHLGMLTLAPTDQGLLAGDGWRLLLCQMLEAGCVPIAAQLIYLVTLGLGMRMGASKQISMIGGFVAWALMLTTPWAIVTGSLAYNEAAVNTMLAAALLVSLQAKVAFPKRCVLAGFFVGAAISLKLTSVFFVSLPVGCVLLAGYLVDTKEHKTRFFSRIFFKGLGAGALATLVVMMPWLVRNAVVSGNPIFPFASSVFGSGHWTTDQLARFAEGHHFAGSLLERLRLLIWTDPQASPGGPAVEVFRGFANPQWGIFLPAVLLAALNFAQKMVAGRLAQERLLVVGLWVGMALQLAAWLWLTHLQSRFLLPMLPMGAVMIGVTVAVAQSAKHTHSRRNTHSTKDTRSNEDARHNEDARPTLSVAMVAGIVLVLVQTGFAFVLYSQEHLDGKTNLGRAGMALAWFPDIFTGTLDTPPDNTAIGWVNTHATDNARVYLEGDSAGLYFGPNAIAHTTWDTSLLGQLARQHPDDPAAWVSELHKQKIGWILVNTSEINRLQNSNWYDPLVTSTFVHAFTESLGGAVRVWPDEGRYLVQITTPTQTSPQKQLQEPGS